MRKRTVQPWEPDITSWFKRHEGEAITPELTTRFILHLFKKKAGWDLALIREIVKSKHGG